MPHYNTIKSLIEKLRATGSVTNNKTSICSAHVDLFGTVIMEVHQTAVTGSGHFQEFCDESHS